MSLDFLAGLTIGLMFGAVLLVGCIALGESWMIR